MPHKDIWQVSCHHIPENASAHTSNHSHKDQQRQRRLLHMQLRRTDPHHSEDSKPQRVHSK